MPVLESKPCPDCGGTAKFNVTAKQLVDFRDGVGFVQNIFPELNADDRERLISGYCPTCWEKLFADEER